MRFMGVLHRPVQFNILERMRIPATISAVCLLTFAGACANTRARAAFPAEIQSVLIAEDARSLEGISPAFSSPDPVVRARAARAAGRTGNKSSILTLRTLALDSNENVACEALFALGLLGAEGLGDPVLFDNLQKSPSEAVRAAAVEAIGRGPRGADFELCHALFIKDASARVRGEAALAMSRLYQKRRALDGAEPSESLRNMCRDLATLALRETDDDARWKEAYALIQLPSRAGYYSIIQLSADPNPLVRLFATRALGKRRADMDNPARDEFDRAIVRSMLDADPRVATEAALAVPAANPPEMFSENLQLLQKNPAWFARRAMLRAFRGFGQIQQKIHASTSTDAWISVLAERAMLRFLPRTEYEYLQKNPHALVREKVTDAIAALPPADALELLARSHADPDYKVCAAAATALAKVESDGARALLLKALTSPHGLVRENAAGSLEEIVKKSKRASLAEVDALLNSAITARGDDLAESLSGILVAIQTIELARREFEKVSIHDRSIGETEHAAKIGVVLTDAASDPDITVRTKAAAAWNALFPDKPAPKILLPAPPVAQIPGVHVPPFARAPRIRIFTNRGSFDAELFHEDAPIHTENFLQLIAAGHYTNTVWHRVELNFVAQGGDHLGDGTGARAAWSGTLRDEINSRRFVRGTIGMPKSDVNDSGGCQIFITHIPTPHLDGRYTAYGQVTHGLAVVDELEVGDRIEKIEILDGGR